MAKPANSSVITNRRHPRLWRVFKYLGHMYNTQIFQGENSFYNSFIFTDCDFVLIASNTEGLAGFNPIILLRIESHIEKVGSVS